MTIAVLDACVLYPPSLRDLLMWLATVRIYSPRWTDEIQSEWIRNVLSDNPELPPAQLDRTRTLMNRVTPNCLVSGYEEHIPTVSLPDANDRHVVAAAIVSRATMIITFNLSDFPDAALRSYGVKAVHPDIFLCALFDEKPELFLRGVKAHRASLQNPAKDAEAYIQTLRTNGIKGLALRIEHQSNII